MSSLNAGRQPDQNKHLHQSKLRTIASTAAPLLVISSLLYAGLFVEQKVDITETERPAIERRDRFYGLAQPQEDILWAVGNIGKVVRSEDHGTTWRIQDSGTRAHLQDIAAWSAEQAVSVGNQGVIVVTDDAGATWRAATAVPDFQEVKLLNVETFSEGEAWAIGERGTVLVSKDFGLTWQSAGINEDVAWNGITLFEDTGILVGEFGRIRVSRDGGMTWADVDSPVDSSLYAVQLRNEKEGVAVGSEGAVVYTKDGGITWETRPTPGEQHLFDVIWDRDRWLTVGDSGAVMAASASAEVWRDITGVAGTGWHTKIVGTSGRYLLAGRGVQEVSMTFDGTKAGKKK